METASLVIAVLALVAALLALRRVEVIGRRARSRAPEPESADSPPRTEVPEGSTSESYGEVEATDLVSGDPVLDSDAGISKESGRRSKRLLGRGPADANAELSRRLAEVETQLHERISRVEVVRYDAFEGAGGQLSFSLALLDDNGQGLVLTTIHGPAETRTYVKQIPLPDDPLLPTELSPEEREVLRRAGSSKSGRRSV